MPELPEVETVVRKFRDRLVGRRIREFTTSWPKNVAPSAAGVTAALRGRCINAVTRRAKFIVFALDDGAHLLTHLRMSGRFEWSADHDSEPRHVRATWQLDDGHRLLFCDARKFGRIIHTRDLAAHDARLGVEPLAPAFTSSWLRAALQRRARQLKPLLLDQTVIAGLGNIYVDESLHRAGLHPLRRSDRLSREQAAALRDAIRAVLREAIRRNGTSIDWVYPTGTMQNHLRAYGRTGEPCDRCSTPIQRLLVGQRSTHICPRCQPRSRSSPGNQRKA